MTTTKLSDKLRDDIRALPDSHVQELCDIVHFLRLELERGPPTTIPDVMRFAGAWKGMEDPEGFEVELRERRHAAFASSRRSEAVAD
jgi:hypothetical protein